MKNIAKLYSVDLEGLEVKKIEIEADLNVGLHSFNVVGLADKSVTEAKERINSALKNCGIKPPYHQNQRITINLAPADTKKTGAHFDLPIALAYLLASKQIKPFDFEDKIFAGELSLDGNLRKINGALNIAIFAQKKGIKTLFLPEENALEAALVKNLEIIPVRNLNQLIEHLEGVTKISPQEFTNLKPDYPPANFTLEEIKGQESVKRALMIAAAGGHNVLMVGPPGTGKTLLAQAFASILPPPNLEEIIEINQIYSAAGLIEKNKIINYRPFRAPHHSASLSAIIGGGPYARPGEISLAHRGVLFLDELPEFHRDVLEALRQPLENGFIHIARAKKSITLPARFIFISAMNPCPCGYFNDLYKECLCTANQIFRYQKKISGPLLDRIDIQINVPRLSLEDLTQKTNNIKLQEDYKNKIIKARQKQLNRFLGFDLKIFTNAEMNHKIVDEVISLDKDAELFLKNMLEKNFISGRGYYRILKLAQTIADLEESENIRKEHLAEAFQYRLKTEE